MWMGTDEQTKWEMLSMDIQEDAYPSGQLFGADAALRDEVSKLIDDEAIEGRGVPEHSSPTGVRTETHSGGVVSEAIARALVEESDRLRIELDRLKRKTHVVITWFTQEDGVVVRYAYGPYPEGEARRLRDSFISASERGSYSDRFGCFALKMIDVIGFEARAHQDLVVEGVYLGRKVSES